MWEASLPVLLALVLIWEYGLRTRGMRNTISNKIDCEIGIFVAQQISPIKKRAEQSTEARVPRVVQRTKVVQFVAAAKRGREDVVDLPPVLRRTIAVV